ncbi:MAG TPA: hypothetical protein VL123_07195 [Candidatus Udaeobacter sp.]|jgi:hypothetical protein|nr:hypothetical protein [Candidatus Udaeobacter sp.]
MRRRAKVLVLERETALRRVLAVLLVAVALAVGWASIHTVQEVENFTAQMW